MTARVSIVMPTYNRRDSIARAIASVRRQTFADWELVVVDDGSTDGTKDVVAALDRRVRLIVQDNQGVAGARNTGLANARGELVAFLDSDDEWPEHHLALATAFFDAHPGEHVFTSEFWEDFGDGRHVKHFRVETGDWYPALAARIGSRAFASAPAHGDPYMWFYSSRTALGPWARSALEGTEHADAFHYRGDIFDKWRWGWLMALQPTVITRHAMETVGPNDTSYRVASDFGYLAALCRAFPVSFVSAPGCIKHELTEDKSELSESHLVTGASAIRFHEDVLRFHQSLFAERAPDDAELQAILGYRHALVAEAALQKGELALAREHIELASRSYRGSDLEVMRVLARAAPNGAIAGLLYRGSKAGERVADKIRRAVEGLR